MSKKNYREASETIVESVGGLDNITECYHCQSRLRLNLRDVSIIDLKAIKKLGFIDAILNGNQLQVIAGNEIYDLYDAMAGVVGKEIAGGEREKDVVKAKLSVKSVFFSIFGGIAASVQPCIPILIGAGMLQCVYLILAQCGVLDAASSTYRVLEFVANAGFYFLPVYVGFNCANKHGGNPLLGALVGAMLLHPSFVAMVDAGEAITLFGLPVRSVSYGSSVLPAYVAVLVMCYVEKFIAKHSPKNVRVVLEPFGTLLIMTPLTLCLLAPIGDYLGVLLQIVLGWIYNVAGPVAPAIIGVLIPFLVVTGTHLVLGPLAVMTLTTSGQEFILMPAALLHNFIHGALALAISLKSKNPEMKSTAASCSFTAFIAGISEPSLYGLALKKKSAMIALLGGQFAGCLYFGITHTGIYMFPGGGMSFLSLAVYLGGAMSNFVNACIGTVIGMAVAFALIFLLYKDEEENIA